MHYVLIHCHIHNYLCIFLQYPLKLFLQLPRYGKKFKSFNRVVPSIKLDVNILCETCKS